jgi:XTP/dITP diphosphohydrolase
MTPAQQSQAGGVGTQVRALLATGNPGKAAEWSRLLAPIAVEPVDLSVEETGDTFAANALAKARAAQRFAGPGVWGLGDDSGLEVAALSGAPGVRSARFVEGDDAARNAAVLRLLDGVDDRRAAFVCVLAAVRPDGRELVVEGRLEGSIAQVPAGSSGFGYDPIFIAAGEQRTLGELGAAFKDSVSHRAAAASAFRRELAQAAA